MTCREILDFLMSYLDGELPADVRASFEDHLTICPSCVAYLQSYQTTVRLSKSANKEEPPPDEVPEELIQAMISAIGRAE